MPSSVAIPPPPGIDRGGILARQVSAAAVGAIVALVLVRAGLAFLDQTELSTDEAQYWFWGQNPDFGTYSKPPLIGWIIGLTTELLGQSVWAVRLPAALIHGATALVLFVLARRLARATVAALATLLYLTTPAVALGSAVMTTDTPLLLAAAVALALQLQLAEARQQGQSAPVLAVAFGLALALGVLAKHAMLFWLVGAVLAAVLSPAFRIRRLDAILAGAVFALAVAPHVLWLAGNSFVTFMHVASITSGGGLSVERPALFLAQQLIVMGPVPFVAMLLIMGQGARDGSVAGLAVLAAVPLLIVLGQAVRGPVLANWAALYLVPGSVLAALWLVRHPWLIGVSLALGLTVSLALPLAKAFGTGLQAPDGRPVLARYLGHAETANWALAAAQAAGAGTLVARDRDLLADLSWFGAEDGLAIRAVPPEGPPRHHWEMTAAFDAKADPAPVVLLLRDGAAMPCDTATRLSQHRAGPGFAMDETLVLFALGDPACLDRKGPKP